MQFGLYVALSRGVSEHCGVLVFLDVFKVLCCGSRRLVVSGEGVG